MRPKKKAQELKAHGYLLLALRNITMTHSLDEDKQEWLIMCPKCKKYIGVKQPIAGAQTLCMNCYIWVTNDGEIAPEKKKKPNKTK